MNKKSLGQAPLLAACLLAAAVPLASAQATALSLLGSVGYTGLVDNMDNQVTGGSLAVDPTNNYVYVGSSFGGSGLLRFDVSTPASPAAPTTIFSANTSSYTQYGAGVAVDPSNGRYATTNGYGTLANNQFHTTLGVFNPDGSSFGSAGVAGCGGSIAAGSGTFGVSTQCTDTFAIFSETHNAIVYSAPIGGVGSTVVYDSANGTYYVDNSPHNVLAEPLAISENGPWPATVSHVPYNIQLYAANGATNLLYGVDASGNVLVLDANTSNYVIRNTITGLNGVQAITADSSLNQMYIASGNAIDAYTGNGGSFLDQFTLDPGYSVTAMGMAAGGNLLYVNAHNGSAQRLYVLQASDPPSGVPEPGTLLLLGPGLAALALRRSRRRGA